MRILQLEIQRDDPDEGQWAFGLVSFKDFRGVGVNSGYYRTVYLAFWRFAISFRRYVEIPAHES